MRFAFVLFCAALAQTASGDVTFQRATNQHARSREIPLSASGITYAGATDLEAVAYDPLTHNVWAANETGEKTIREYDPTSGVALATLDVPPIMLGDYGNLGFESLTISPDGLTLWTANEESLKVDGPTSSHTVSSTNRLVKFTRTDGKSPWKLAAMYPYVTDRWHRPFGLGGLGRRGISDMCALPDGAAPSGAPAPHKIRRRLRLLRPGRFRHGVR